MYTNILYATDLSETHFQISERAAKIAEKLEAKLYIMHVVEMPASMQLAQGLGFTELTNLSTDDAAIVLNNLGEALNIPNQQQFVATGSVCEHVLTKAKELGCQLIIIGSHDQEGLPSLMGSKANAIIQHASCDVMTLKA